MTVNQKVTGTAWGVPAGLAWGAAVSMGLTTAMSALAAWMVLNGRFSVQSIGYCSMAILALSAAAGAAAAIGRIKRCRFQVCMAAGAVYYGCLLAVTALFFGGIYEGMGVTALMVLCGCSLVVLMGGTASGGRRRRKGKSRK